MPKFGDKDKIQELLIAHNISLTDAVARGNFYKEYFDWDSLKREYENGRTIKDLCTETSLSYDVVRMNLKRAGVLLRNSTTDGRYSREYFFRLDYFKTLNHYGAYFLGWMYSDGCLTKNLVDITLNTLDNEHLDYITGLVSNKPLIPVKNGFSFRYFSVDVSEYFKSEYNVLPNKSHINFRIPFEKFGEFTPYLLLGILEGDGSIAKTHPAVQFLLPEKSMYAMLGYLNSMNVHHYDCKIEFLNKYKLTSAIFKGKSYFSVLHFIYSNTKLVIPLKRKYDIFNNQLSVSANGKTSPYKKQAQCIRDSLLQ